MAVYWLNNNLMIISTKALNYLIRQHSYYIKILKNRNKEGSFLRFLQSLYFQPRAHNAMEGHPFTPVFTHLLVAFLEHICQPFKYLIRHLGLKTKSHSPEGPWQICTVPGTWQAGWRNEVHSRMLSCRWRVSMGTGWVSLCWGVWDGKCAHSYPRAWWPQPLWAKIPWWEKPFDGACQVGGVFGL